MARTATASAEFGAPFSEMNTTPLIDVLLVLLVMLILAVPAAVNQVPIELPSAAIEHPYVEHDRNKIAIDPRSAITWNGQPVSAAQLASLLQATRKLKPEPELQFQPDPAAPYDTASKVLNTIKASGVTAFGFVGNDSYADFGKGLTVAR